MTPAQTQVLHNLASIVLLIAVWYGVYKNTCLERFRHELFRIRNEMFDFMMRGGIEATNPAYLSLRQLINAAIRYAEQFGFLRTVVLARSLRPSLSGPDSPRMRLENLLGELTGDQAKVMRRFYDRMLMAYVIFLFLSSVVSLVSLVGVIVMAVASRLVMGSAELMKRGLVQMAMRPIEAEAMRSELASAGSA